MMAWDQFFLHRLWSCCPERYGKFQSEIPSTPGAICEKNTGGPLPPTTPPAGRGLTLPALAPLRFTWPVVHMVTTDRECAVSAQCAAE